MDRDGNPTTEKLTLSDYKPSNNNLRNNLLATYNKR